MSRHTHHSQPFYHLLVEVSDWGYDAAQPPVAYVAQELLAAPELEDDGASWTHVSAQRAA
jgi:hemimethylated DNA binding protein